MFPILGVFVGPALRQKSKNQQKKGTSEMIFGPSEIEEMRASKNSFLEGRKVI